MIHWVFCNWGNRSSTETALDTRVQIKKLRERHVRILEWALLLVLFGIWGWKVNFIFLVLAEWQVGNKISPRVVWGVLKNLIWLLVALWHCTCFFSNFVDLYILSIWTLQPRIIDILFNNDISDRHEPIMVRIGWALCPLFESGHLEVLLLDLKLEPHHFLPELLNHGIVVLWLHTPKGPSLRFVNFKVVELGNYLRQLWHVT
jgi:hypothetical protein